MKRWIIRSFFIGLLLLCVGGWAGSTASMAAVSYGWAHRHIVVGTTWGCVLLAWGDDAYMGDEVGWRCEFGHADTVRFFPPGDELGDFHLGFGYGGISNHMRRLGVPYWFLTLLFGSVLFIVWRKTGLPVKGRGFPVELGEKEKPI